MALVAVYDKEGNKKMKEPVDARECVEHLGFTLEPPEVKAEAQQEAVEPVEPTDSGKPSKGGKKGK